MNSKILQIASKYLNVLFLSIALMALFRGHNQPGGGFIGGLIAALSVIFLCLAYNHKHVKNRLKFRTEFYIAIGLILVFASILPGIFLNKNLMEGIWLNLTPSIFKIKIGTPLLFDIGVFFTVFGVTLLFYFNLSTTE